MDLSQYIKQKKKIRKLLLLGSGAVGKTSILKVFKDTKNLNQIDESEQHYKRTLFLELEAIHLSEPSRIEEEGVFQIYDIAGQINMPVHATRDIAKMVFGSVDLVILMFSNNSVQSLFDIEYWIQIIDNYNKTVTNGKYCSEFILIKNKTDLKGTIDELLVKKILKHEKRIIKYFAISCFDGQGIEELKTWLTAYGFGSGKKSTT